MLYFHFSNATALRTTLLICFVFLFVSCEFIEKQTKREPIPVVDTIVDFNSVDAFPLFPECNEIPSRKRQQICFQVNMSEYINAGLKKYPWNAWEQVNDTVMLKLMVDKEGKTSMMGVRISEETQKILPKFDSVLRESVKEVPQLKPAIKRDIPVATSFVLPIILQNKKDSVQ